MNQNRLIGIHSGKEKGPLFICLGGIHGNEPAGVLALEKVFQMLEEEYVKNPQFEFKGKMLGLRGNLVALKAGVRYVDQDMNRSWGQNNIRKISNTKGQDLNAEEKEVKAIIEIVHQAIIDYQPDSVIVLDLHTTTATGGIFIIPALGEANIEFAKQFPVPVIIGALKGLEGSTMHYFTSKNLGVPTRAFTFESGQHNEPLSVNRAIAIIINCLKFIGCVKPEDVENRHNQILIKYSKDLPKITRLIDVHDITPEDQFKMKSGFTNFHPVKKGTLLAEDRNGQIHASEDGYILMPHYQEQGDEGFFLVQEIE